MLALTLFSLLNFIEVFVKYHIFESVCMCVNRHLAVGDAAQWFGASFRN